jgi:alpha-D-ribose 1-methylphosphonate 5-triphosphate synthase subunit PhnL
MLDKLQHPLLVKTVDAINKAQTSSRQADVNAARALILDMPEVWRNAYSSAIDAAQNKVIANALEAIKKAQISGVLVDKAMATALYNELLTVTNNDAVKVWAQTVLKGELDKIVVKN